MIKYVIFRLLLYSLFINIFLSQPESFAFQNYPCKSSNFCSFSLREYTHKKVFLLGVGPLSPYTNGLVVHATFFLSDYNSLKRISILDFPSWHTEKKTRKTSPKSVKPEYCMSKNHSFLKNLRVVWFAYSTYLVCTLWWFVYRFQGQNSSF